MLDWEMGLLRGKSDCVQALAWLVIHDGRTVPIADVEVKVIKFFNAYMKARSAEVEAQAADRAAADEQDPTGLPGPLLSPPRGGTSVTSGNGETISRVRSRKA